MCILNIGAVLRVYWLIVGISGLSFNYFANDGVVLSQTVMARQLNHSQIDLII